MSAPVWIAFLRTRRRALAVIFIPVALIGAAYLYGMLAAGLSKPSDVTVLLGAVGMGVSVAALVYVITRAVVSHSSKESSDERP